MELKKNYLVTIIYLDRWQDKYITQTKNVFYDTLTKCYKLVEIYKRDTLLLHATISKFNIEDYGLGYCTSYDTIFILDKTKTKGVLEYVGR